MALKDWKKVKGIAYFGKYVQITYQNPSKEKKIDIFAVGHSLASKQWGVMSYNPPRLLKYFTSKKQALKFAKSYMRKH